MTYRPKKLMSAIFLALAFCLCGFCLAGESQAENSSPAVHSDSAETGAADVSATDTEDQDDASKPRPDTKHENDATVAEPAPVAQDAVAAVEPSAQTQVTDAGLSDENMDFLNEENGGASSKPDLADPLEPVNRAIFKFNDKLYFGVLKPVAQGYGKVVPGPARKGIRNFFNNIAFPVRFTNCVLQGKGSAAEGEFARFFANSTFGCLGFRDLGEKYPQLAPPDPEDTGQTLGKWGLGGGFYLVLPFFGPSSARDACGTAVDKLLLDPVSYVNPISASAGISTVDRLNRISLSIGDYETIKDAAFDPYTSFRDAFMQHRKSQLSK